MHLTQEAWQELVTLTGTFIHLRIRRHLEPPREFERYQLAGADLPVGI